MKSVGSKDAREFKGISHDSWQKFLFQMNFTHTKTGLQKDAIIGDMALKTCSELLAGIDYGPESFVSILYLACRWDLPNVAQNTINTETALYNLSFVFCQTRPRVPFAMAYLCQQDEQHLQTAGRIRLFFRKQLNWHFIQRFRVSTSTVVGLTFASCLGVVSSITDASSLHV